ncbi:ABC transporter ATP-binding protein [Gracilibacillus phocaeensis]|uniref:ABC transporter ATP-binding protein n=1 Tax=Gracilibacillus phocaeensis TaxID=2042304 RepID=UPI0010301FE5|nr:ABC transporter ATP-binding protein [Gracilibacillus phocaeensis]
MSILTLSNIHKTFKTGEVEEEIIKGIDLALPRGGITALTGASGSGKSTLLTIAAGLQPATSGHIYFDSIDLTSLNPDQVRKIRAEQFGFVFQFAHLVPFLTVAEQLTFMLEVAITKQNKKQQAQAVEQLLERVDMQHRSSAYPSSLSGGEKQRVAIARAVIHQPQVLFADEPTASLDSKRSTEAMNLIRDITKQLDITTLMVTHDSDTLSYADHVVEMQDGKLC